MAADIRQRGICGGNSSGSSRKEAQAGPMLDRTMAGEQGWPDSPRVTELGIAKSTDFTERELEVLSLLAKGLTNREIAIACSSV